MAYGDHPPTCIYFLIKWKVTLKTEAITRVTEPDLGDKSKSILGRHLEEKVESVRWRRPFQNRQLRVP
jgi:hypothetical protein